MTPILLVFKETRKRINGDNSQGSGDIPEGIPEEDSPEEGIQDEGDIRGAEGIRDALMTHGDKERSLPPLVTITWRKPHCRPFEETGRLISRIQPIPHLQPANPVDSTCVIGKEAVPMRVSFSLFSFMLRSSLHQRHTL